MVIGLTGGIATGKSTVSNLLRSMGARIIDSDQIAREVVMPGKPAYLELVKYFGKESLLPDGSLNRKWIGGRVFSNPQARKRLEEITHPFIFEEIRKGIERAKEEGIRWIVLDAPLLFETGLDKAVDLTLLVDTDEKTQLARLMERDLLSKEEAEKRIASQLPLEVKRRKADYILPNHGSLEALRKEVEAMMRWVEEEWPEGMK